ncbi:MAG: alpha/beta hydrolase [Bacteroidetes bacterium]|nr:alpha/beta hydrolase [Bacteroidota bacterium]
MASACYAQKVIYDTAYRAENYPQCKLDLYIPAHHAGFPTIVFLHEGSLIGGDKKENRLPEIAQKFMGDGIAVALVNYRLAPDTWPAQPDDACAAFAWVRKNIRPYGGDDQKVFIAGHSSGALLAALISTDPVYLAKQGLKLQNIAGSIVIGTQLKAELPAVPENKLDEYFKNNVYLKIFGNRQTFEDASPMAHINKDIPPMRFIMAEAEQDNPPILAQTKEFIDKANAFNKDIGYHVIRGRKHMTVITQMPESGDETYRVIKDFVSTVKRKIE